MEVAMKSNLNVVMELYHVRKYKYSRTFILFLFHVENREMAKLIFINMLLPQRLTRFGCIQAQLYVAVIDSLNLVKASYY